MRIDRLDLSGFRNYDALSVAFDPRCNVIYGENAQGKTNLLEALAYLSRGRSPRTRSDRELIGFGREEASLDARVSARDRAFQVEISLSRTRRRRVQINRIPAAKLSDLSGVVRTVFFQPEDLSLIRAGAAERRRFLDAALCQLRPRYAAALSAYRGAWARKTRILRDGDPAFLAVLPEFSAQMVRAGAVLVRTRARFIRSLSAAAERCHAECSGGRETLALRYQTQAECPEGTEAEIAASLARHMEAHAAAERAARQCLSGPHKDDLLSAINGLDARTYASQGQTRTAALSLKLAEREMFQEDTGEPPVLLLDDVLSELDPRRQEFVLNRVGGGQAFLTCCEDDRLSRLLGGKVLHVENGRVTE